MPRTAAAVSQPFRQTSRRLDHLQHGKTFLSLPLEIRRLIYLEAGVCRNELIDLNYYGRIAWEGPRGVRAAETNEALLGLLLSCSAIHDEVEVMIYAENSFVVTLNAEGGLDPLENLSATALRNLKCLVVRLFTCTCTGTKTTKSGSCKKALPLEYYFYHREEKYWRSDSWSAHNNQRRLKFASNKIGYTRKDQTSLTQWTKICASLAEYVRPDQMRLYLTVLPKDVQVLKVILEPLEKLPRLLDAAVSVRQRVTRNHELAGLARSTVLRLTGRLDNTNEAKPFRFMDLPVELQRMILTHTELSAGDNVHCNWHNRDKGTLYFMNCMACRNYPYTPGSLQPWRSPQLAPKDVAPAKDRLSQMFSPMHSLAYRAGCMCYRSDLGVPAAFLVSKAFAAVARDVFFGANIFTVHLQRCDYDPNNPVPNGSLLQEPGLACFVRMLTSTPGALAALRSIRIMLPPLHRDYLPRHGEDLWPGWTDALDLLVKHANLPALRLEFRFTDSQQWLEDLDQQRLMRDRTAEEAMWAAYERVVLPLQRLRGGGLQILFIYPVWPVHFQMETERWNWGKRLERIVMGKDYDSDLFGKPYRGWPEQWVASTTQDIRIQSFGRWQSIWAGIASPIDD